MTFRVQSGWYPTALRYEEVLSKYNYRSISRDGSQVDLIDINSIEELIELQTELKKQPGTQWGIVIDDGDFPEYKEITIYDNYLE